MFGYEKENQIHEQEAGRGAGGEGFPAEPGAVGAAGREGEDHPLVEPREPRLLQDAGRETSHGLPADGAQSPRRLRAPAHEATVRVAAPRFKQVGF